MNHPNPYYALALLFTLLACPWSAAQVRVTFPLNGYYRVGKYMPVRVTGTDTASPVVIRADGAVAVSVSPGHTGVDTIVPWLAADEVRTPRWESGRATGPIDEPLTPVEPNQALVGVVGPDVGAAAEVAARLFPGKSVVAVPLTGTPPVGGNPAAWEALDAIVFDAPDNVLLADLLRNGMTVVIRSPARPGGDWPWQGGPGRWFLRFDAAGPPGAIHPDVYDAVAAWRPGWPAPLRRRALLLTAVLCIVALGITLWRRTFRAALAVAAASVAAAAGLAYWGARQSMVCEISTGVSIVSNAGSQYDHWTYLRPLRRRQVVDDWRGKPKPVFASARHLRETDLTLHVGASGRPFRFTWNAPARGTVAFLNRSFGTYPGPVFRAATRPPLTPTGELAKSSYLGPGDTVLDDPSDRLPPDDSDWLVAWPPVTIRRANR